MGPGWTCAINSALLSSDDSRTVTTSVLQSDRTANGLCGYVPLITTVITRVDSEPCASRRLRRLHRCPNRFLRRRSVISTLRGRSSAHRARSTWTGEATRVRRRARRCETPTPAASTAFRRAWATTRRRRQLLPPLWRRLSWEALRRQKLHRLLQTLPVGMRRLRTISVETVPAGAGTAGAGTASNLLDSASMGSIRSRLPVSEPAR